MWCTSGWTCRRCGPGIACDSCQCVGTWAKNWCWHTISHRTRGDALGQVAKGHELQKTQTADADCGFYISSCTCAPGQQARGVAPRGVDIFECYVSQLLLWKV
eukprot:138626-Chlamydomonas_euryale.AAC.4